MGLPQEISEWEERVAEATQSLHRRKESGSRTEWGLGQDAACENAPPMTRFL